MIKYLAIPLILVGCTAPVTDPPAHACSPRLDGGFTFCPNPDEPFPDPKPIIKPKPIIPKEELRGEIDIYNPMHWHQMQTMFQRNARRNQIEQTATKPSDAINSALAEYNYGSNDTTEQEELLQLQSNGD
jgi:hypothetical protein